MSALANYKKIAEEIARARSWGKHLSASGRGGERAIISSIGADPSICIQYSTGGKNYWDCKEETGEMFRKRLNTAFSKRLGECINEAIAALQTEQNKFKAEAMAEYKTLFNEELAA